MLKKSSQLAVASIAGLGMLSGAVRDLHAAIVIEEVYGGGGSTSTVTVPTYSQDFIELYNNGVAPVSLTGDILAYGSAGSTSYTGTSTILTIGAQQTIQPGGYYLISGGGSTTYTGAALPVTPDATSSLALSASAGEVSLFPSGTTLPIAAGTSALTSTAIDTVGYGTAKQYETNPVAALSVTTAAYRTSLGVDTNVNSTDFTVGAVQAPQSSTSSSVPEPTGLGLVGVASSLLVRRRKAAARD